MNDRIKQHLITVLKILVAGGLIYWMVDSGKLDFKQLGIFLSRLDVLFVTIIGWMFLVLCQSIRWFVLLRGIGIKAPYFRVFRLHMIGVFFNSTMPGAVGGDIIKAVYVIRDNQMGGKTHAMLTIMLDRVIGLMGMFMLGTIAVTLNFSSFWANPILRPMILVFLGLLLFTIIFYTLVFIPISEEKDIFLKLFSKPYFGFSLLKKIYIALRSYRDRPMALVFALILSVFIQSMIMFYFIFITTVFNNTSVNMFDFATIYPIGIFTTALPLAPGGLGVGHVAFEKLFEMINLQNGANVFNIFFLSMISLNLLGIFPYITLKKAEKVEPENLENSAQTS